MFCFYNGILRTGTSIYLELKGGKHTVISLALETEISKQHLFILRFK